jgi:PBSX family phage terminase large subunit
LTTSIRLSEKVLPAFKDFWKASDKYLYKVLKGGRNSAKSTHISMRVIYDLMKHPINALVVRKVGKTLSESVYEQLKWAIEYLGVSRYWHAKKSPLELIYVPRGNKIIFRGADEPQKIKSIKTSRFPITHLWVEELADFKTEEEIETIVNSILRDELPGNLQYSIFYSYNPPKRKQNWTNKKYNTQFISNNTFVHHSSYLDNPFTSKQFIEEAEEVKLRNERKYQWIYLGEPIGGGIVPFSNLTFREITEDEVKAFDNIRQGLDWGYAADPLAFVRTHYDKRRKKLFFIGEIHQVKMSNRELAEEIKRVGYNDFPIIADSAEPKSIAEMRTYGIDCRDARKGPGSVEFGEKWLDDLEEIVIDFNRTPNIAREYENIDYQIDKDGNIKNKLEDKDNHSIDATRYALEDDMTERTVKATQSLY